MKKLYKILHNNQSCSGGNSDWSKRLPKDGKPGRWTPKRTPSICNTGWHGTDAAHLLNFAEGNQLWEVEAEDVNWSSEGDKFVASRMRLVRQVEGWNEKNLHLFAVWCARQVEHLMTDERSKNALNVAERYANGEATDDELVAAWDAASAAASAAAWVAARDAAWDAASAAARAAARAAAWDAARDAARAAAWVAAWDAASAAARAAAWAAARDAAWDAASAAASAAARAAAWDAARDAAWVAAWDAASAAARAAARDAAWDAAWAAARAAARDAAWAAQYKKLYEMIGLEVE